MLFGALFRRDQPRSEIDLDPDQLRSLAVALRNSRLAASHQRLSKIVGALSVCLRRQEKSAASLPEFDGKENIGRDIVVARQLVDKIDIELDSMADDGGPANAAS